MIFTATLEGACSHSVSPFPVAKKGYGSMAVANCQGTQIINIAVGLGGSWLMCCTASEIRLSPILLYDLFFWSFLWPMRDPTELVNF